MFKEIFQLGVRTRNGPSFEEWISESDLSILLNCLSHSGNGVIPYQDFLTFALDCAENDEIIDTHEKLRKEIFIRSKLKYKDIVKLFCTVKTFSNGYVRSSEFKTIIRKISPKITSSDAEIVVCYLDPDKEGTVDFNLFAVWVHTGHSSDEVCVYV